MFYFILVFKTKDPSCIATKAPDILELSINSESRHNVSSGRLTGIFLNTAHLLIGD